MLADSPHEAAAMYAELENSDLRGEIARLERKLEARSPAENPRRAGPREARMAIYELDGVAPEFPADGLYWVAETASVIGKVRLHTKVSIWYGSVLRGDNEWIEIGTRSQIQDNARCIPTPAFRSSSDATASSAITSCCMAAPSATGA